MDRMHAIRHAAYYRSRYGMGGTDSFVPAEWLIKALMDAPHADWVARVADSQQARDEEVPDSDVLLVSSQREALNRKGERLEIAKRLAWDELKPDQQSIYLAYANCEIHARCPDCHGSGEQFHQAHRGEETVFEGMINCQSCGGTGVKK